MDLSTVFFNQRTSSEGGTGAASDSKRRKTVYSGTNFVEFMGTAKSNYEVREPRVDDSRYRQDESRRSSKKVKGGEMKTNSDLKATKNEREYEQDINGEIKQDDRVKEKVKTDIKSNEANEKEVDDVKVEEPETDNLVQIINSIIASEDEITGKLSEILNIPKEQIESALNELNISALDLLDKSNLNSFMQKAMNVQDTVQLLSVPDIKNAYKSINELLEGYSDQVEQLKSMDVNDAAVDLTADIMSESTAARQQDNESNIAVENSVKNAINSKITDVTVSTAQDKGQNTSQNVSQNASQNAYATNEQAPVTVRNIFQMMQAKIAGIKEGIVHPDQLNDMANTVDMLLQTSQQVEEVVDINLGLGNDRGSEFLGQNSDFNDFGQPIALNAVQTNATSSFAQAIKNESARNINHADVVNQIIEKLKVEIKGNISEMKLTLKPEHLGDVTLKVQTQNGIVTAQFLAENQRVKEIIEANFNQLRSVLEEQGVNISQLTVSIGGQESQEQGTSRGYQQRRDNRTNRTIGSIDETEIDTNTEDDLEISNSRVNYTV